MVMFFYVRSLELVESLIANFTVNRARITSPERIGPRVYIARLCGLEQRRQQHEFGTFSISNTRLNHLADGLSRLAETSLTLDF